jgi:tetratricopeptide (TPR) repeat protein/O-antigen ligase
MAVEQPVPCACPNPDSRQRLSTWLRAAMETVVLLLMVLLPWGFSWVLGLVEWVLFTGVAIVLLLWAARMLLEWRPIWVACPITLCLAGLFLLGVWQITPLPRSLLATLSPATTELNTRLLPPNEASHEAGPLEAETTISLYPGGTRAYLLRLLAVVALFAAVRSNVATAASFRRLAVVALVNGFLLALVGLLQFFSSPRNVIYWTFESPAHVFGPFNRNEFAFHNNLCIGLGIGLLLAGRMSLSPRGHNRGPRRFGDDPTTLWIAAALVLMLTALALCLSRGGVFSLLGAVAIVAVLGGAGRAGSVRFGVVGVLLCLALGLAAWFGLGEMQGRMAQLWTNDGPGHGRWQMWLQTAPYVRAFPVWGTGFTTFGFLERMSRGPGMGLDVVYENAHNDYLNLLLEGGLVGLALGLAGLGLAWGYALRACWRHREQPVGGLALGGLLALATATLHSFVDYGLQLPAIAVLAAVLVAHLAAVGSEGAEGPRRPSGGWAFVPRTAGTLLGTAAAIALGWALLNEGRARELAERYRLAAQALETSSERSARQRRITYLGARASLTPTDAERQQFLADALYEAFRADKAALQVQARAVEVTSRVLAWGEVSGSPVIVAGQAVLAAARDDVLAREERRLSDEYLRPALERYQMARRLCPLLARPHVCLAAHAGAAGEGEPASAHLSRARLLLPYNAQVWFLSGVVELQQGTHERAWQSWRRSLECSSEHLEEIVIRSRKHLSPEALVALVLPDDPEVLYEAALKLAGEEEKAQRPLLRRAVERLRERRGEPKDESLLLEARALVRLNRPEEALPVFERLAARSPRSADWRFEFAQVLHERGRLDEARRELRALLQQQPEHRRGKELYQEVLRRQSERR